MTYFGFLLRFLIFPIIVLSALLVVFGVALMLAVNVDELKRGVLPGRAHVEGEYREA